MPGEMTVTREQLMLLATAARQLRNPPAQLPPGAQAGERVARQTGRGLNFDSLRRYQPGDDVRLIDWQATARLRTPWVRLYNEERERPVLVCTDQRLDMFFATRGQMKSVAAAQTAALLAWRAWHDGDRLGSLVFGDDRLQPVPCRSPAASLPPLLASLESFNAALPARYQSGTTGPVTLLSVLIRLDKMMPPGAWLAFISDFHDLDPACETLLARLCRRGSISAFIMLDDLHLRLPASGELGAYYQQVRTTVSLTPSLQQRIREQTCARLATLENRLARTGCRVNQLVVSEPLLPQLRPGV
ncbi:DUF58 domain-containing protein [Mangrovibacter plantisponsor]|uniref:Uncharacterized protein DUF58 n=1 Tax=Mangrovibacter plantisponsor TaxID=451513 RepID=A0A317PYK6_9ENTR|nr:DUF58 domain-containing protein [Mangrovibacter plantisponsor]PWW07770.1 uncharacterized protein DUF58 [Mangrovibacter plantisponsor]